MKIVTRFPGPITETEWEAQQALFLEPGFYALVAGMLESGEILRQTPNLYADSSSWEVVFRDRVACARWQQEVAQMGLIKDPVYKSLGYQIETYFS